VLGSVWLHRATTTAVPVVAAARTIERGTVIERADLVVVRIEKDVALRTIPASKLDSLVGQRALLDVGAGSLLTPAGVGKHSVPRAGHLLVSVPVDSTMVPTGLVAGDRVQFVSSGNRQAEPRDPVPAVVVSVRSASTGSPKVIVEVTVAQRSAATLAEVAGSGDVMVFLESRDR